MTLKFRRRRESRRAYAARVEAQNAQLQGGLLQVAVQFGSFVQMNLRARVWWLLTGRYDETKSVRTARAVDEAAQATEDARTA